MTNGKLMVPLEPLDLSKIRTLKQHETLLRKAQAANQLSPWWIGDIMVSAEDKLGEESSQLYDADDETLRIYEYVSRKFPFVIRITELSFSHHRVVSSFPKTTAIKLLKMARDENWTVKQLKKAIKESQQVDDKSKEEDEDEPEEPQEGLQDPEEIREEPMVPSDNPPHILAKQMRRPFGELVRGLDSLAYSVKGKKWPNYQRSWDALVEFHECFMAMAAGEEGEEPVITPRKKVKKK